MDEFGVDAATVSSLVTLYLGAVTIALLASGSLGDRYGQRPVFLIGVVAFALSSLLAAVAPSFAVLAVARVLQAVERGAHLDDLGGAGPGDRPGRPARARPSGSSTCWSRSARPSARSSAGCSSARSAGVPCSCSPCRSRSSRRSLVAVRRPRRRAATRDRTRGPVAATPPGIDVPGLVLLAAVLIALPRGDPRPRRRRARPPRGARGRPAGGPVRPIRAGRPIVRRSTRGCSRAGRSRRPCSASWARPSSCTPRSSSCRCWSSGCRASRPRRRGSSCSGISGLWAVAAPFGGRLSDRVGRRRPVVAGLGLPDRRAGRAVAVRGRSTPARSS